MIEEINFPRLTTYVDEKEEYIHSPIEFSKPKSYKLATSKKPRGESLSNFSRWFFVHLFGLESEKEIR